MILAGILMKLLFGMAFSTERGRIKLFGRMDWTSFPSLALNLQTIGKKARNHSRHHILGVCLAVRV
jgi:hypothetical protein